MTNNVVMNRLRTEDATTVPKTHANIQSTAQGGQGALPSAQWEFRLRVLDEQDDRIDSDVEQDSHQVASG